MKKMYDIIVRGYYVMSVVLGVLLALSLAMALEVLVLDAASAALDVSDEAWEAWDRAWCFLPLGVCDVFYLTIGSYWQNVLMVTLSILTVGYFVRMSGSKNSRTKILQTVAVALFVLLLMMAYRYAFHQSYLANGALALVPVVLMAIPLTILKKTQQIVRRNTDENVTRKCSLRAMWYGWKDERRDYVRGAGIGALIGIIVLMGAYGVVVVLQGLFRTLG